MIFQTDVVIKQAIELSLQDIRENIWLIDYILSNFTSNPFLQNKYGEKQVTACKEWFLNNNINIFHEFVKDKDKFPALILTLGSSRETQEYRTMGDVGSQTVTLMPNQIGQQIPYVIKPVEPIGYDMATGYVEFPANIDLGPISQGMVLLNPANGNGYVIQGVKDNNIIVQPNIPINASLLGIVPQYRFFQSRLGRSFFEEQWDIVCVANDPQSLLWLHSIMIFGLLRYREFMESNGILEITNLSSTDIFNPNFVSMADGEELFARQISISNKVLQTWIRGLHREIESILLRSTNQEAVTLDNPNGYVGGIVILSNETTQPLQQNNTNWYTEKD
jgi:hypothetical protein